MPLTLEVHNIHTKFSIKYMCYNILCGMVCGILGEIEGFLTLQLYVPLQIVLSGKTTDVNSGIV